MDARPLARWAGAITLVVAPLSITLGTFVPSYGEESPVADQLAAVAGSPGSMATTNLLGIVQLLIVPAMFFVALLARRGSPRLSLIGGGISLLAWLAGMVAFGAYGLALEAAAAAPDRASAAAVMEGLGAGTAYNILVLSFVAGHIIGMLLLGIGLWRSQVAPAWVGLSVAFLPVLHVGARMLGPIADGIIWALLTVAMSYLALILVRMRDDDWDLAPVTLRTAVPSPV
jgi:hypothetical protein